MKSIGILAGAGPYAGIVLHKKIIEYYNAKGIYKDCDFPLIKHVSYPFKCTDASGVMDIQLAIKEMSLAIEILGDVSIIALACNSLLPSIPINHAHKIIDPRAHLQKFIDKRAVLILASQTSCDKEVYKQISDIIYYPEFEIQNRINYLIDQVMRGIINENYFNDLITQCRLQYPNAIILLGCTELCVFKNQDNTINMMDILVKEIV